MAQPNLMNEAGVIGVTQFAGRYEDRYLAELQGAEGITAMADILRKEPVAYTIHNAFLLLARQAAWHVTPASSQPGDEEVAETIESMLGDMSREWWAVLRFALSCLPFGFSDVEIVLKRRAGLKGNPQSLYDDGLVGLRKLAIRRQETIDHWVLDDNGDPAAMVQVDPSSGSELPACEIERLLHFQGGDDRGGWEGTGWLEVAYSLAHMITAYEILLGVGLQRAFTGLPTFRYDAIPGGTTKTDIENMLRNLVNNEQAFVTYAGPIGQFSLETVSMSNASDIQHIIDQKRWEMGSLILAQFLRLGSTSSGSRALADPLIRLFYQRVDGALDDIADVVSRHLIPRLFSYNPEWLNKVTQMPRLDHTSVATLSLNALGDLDPVTKFLQAQPQPEDQNWLRSMIGMPELPEGELLGTDDDDETAAPKEAAPQEAPTVGKEAPSLKGAPAPELRAPPLSDRETVLLAALSADYRTAAQIMAESWERAENNGHR